MLLLLAWGCYAFGCTQAPTGYKESAMVEEYAIETSSEADVESTDQSIEVPQQVKVIKTGRMGLRVERLDEAKRRVDSLVAAYRGYYAQEEYGEEYCELTIRLPQERFDRFMTGAQHQTRGKLRHKEITAQDVTEQYYDVQTRLENKRSYLERYREILGRATTIKDIMEIEQHIRQLEEEIESAEGRLRHLNNQVNYSTLTLTIGTDDALTPNPDNFFMRIHRALIVGWKWIVSLLVGLVYLWPLWLIAGVAIWLIRQQIQRRKRKA